MTSSMRKHILWLKQEIQSWTDEGIISSDQAQQLSARYNAITTDNPWGKVIFSAIGALLIGLGVILFFAYNWEAMHRFTKLALVLVAVIIAHGAGWHLSFRNATHDAIHNKNSQAQSSARLGESLHLLGSILFGAGIWLIAQIYHIDEHYPNGILIWSLGALAMAWALSSSLQALLAMALIGFWCGAEVFDFRRDLDWAPWVIAALVMPLAWRKNSPLLMFFSSVLFLLLLFFVSVFNDFEMVVHLLFILAVGFMSLAKLVPAFRRAELSGVLYGVGTLVYFSLLFAFTFTGVITDIYLNQVNTLALVMYLLLPLCIVLGIGFVVWRQREQLLPSSIDRIDASLKFLTLIAFMGSTLLTNSGMPAILFNVVMFVHSILYLLSGMEHVRWQRVAFGSFILALLVFVRFLDLFDSLLLRSLSFVLLGIGLFVIGILFSRQKASQEVSQHG